MSGLSNRCKCAREWYLSRNGQLYWCSVSDRQCRLSDQPQDCALAKRQVMEDTQEEHV